MKHRDKEIQPLTVGKNTSNINNRRGKSFGYQVLGFGSGGVAPKFTIACGGTVTTSGNFKIHTFTNPGTFTVSQVGDVDQVSYVVVAGGAGGGGCQGGGGGGAGGYREAKASNDCYSASPLLGSAVSVTASSFPITVGNGGGGGPPSGNGSNGNNSVFSSITSTGGGGGGRGGGLPASNSGQP